MVAATPCVAADMGAGMAVVTPFAVEAGIMAVATPSRCEVPRHGGGQVMHVAAAAKMHMAAGTMAARDLARRAAGPRPARRTRAFKMARPHAGRPAHIGREALRGHALHGRGARGLRPAFICPRQRAGPLPTGDETGAAQRAGTRTRQSLRGARLQRAQRTGVRGARIRAGLRPPPLRSGILPPHALCRRVLAGALFLALRLLRRHVLALAVRL